MKKKVALLLAGVLAVSAAVVGCGKSDDSEGGDGIVSIFSHDLDRFDGADKDSVWEYIEEQCGVKLEISGAPMNGYNEKINLMVNNFEAPDIFFYLPENSDTYYDNIFFDYKITENSNNAAFYVQIGGVDYEEVGAAAGAIGSVMTTLTVGSANGNPEVLQIFANQPGMKMIIDNIRIEKFVTPTTLFDENFNEIPLYNWAPNNGGIVNLTSDVTKLPSSGDGNPLYVNCASIYDGVIMTPIHTTIQTGQTYDISFDIKALNVPTNAGLYIQSGNFVLVHWFAVWRDSIEKEQHYEVFLLFSNFGVFFQNYVA